MADIIIYNTNDGKTDIKLYADNGTVWLTQAQIAELFNKERSGISKHIKNFFNEGELYNHDHPSNGWFDDGL
jgi:hypothetical protein